jgi:hypothetical protein
MSNAGLKLFADFVCFFSGRSKTTPKKVIKRQGFTFYDIHVCMIILLFADEMVILGKSVEE